MTVTESVIFRVSLFLLAVTVFTACTTTGTTSDGRRPQSAGYNRR